MEKIDVIEIIETIITSLKTNPNQFSFEINVIGTQITSNGGTGMSISVSGGGPGSNTIGYNSSMNNASIQISNKIANDEINRKYNELIYSLNNILIELRNDNTDILKVKSIFNSFKNTWIPGVIIGVIGNALSKVIGI